MTEKMSHGFSGLQENGKFAPLPSLINEFRGEEYPLNFYFDPAYQDMTAEEMEGRLIGTANTCGPKQYLYWEQGMVVARGRK